MIPDCLGRALLWVTPLCLMSGCAVYVTPDGQRLTASNSGEAVRGRLGEPDLIEEQDRFYMGPYVATTYTYLERGYAVGFVNHRVRAVRVLDEAGRAAAVLRVRAYREEVPRLALGAAGPEVLSVYGVPDHVDISREDGGITRGVYSGRYRSKEDLMLADCVVLCYWVSRGVFARLERGRVACVRPLTEWDLGVVEGGPQE